MQEIDIAVIIVTYRTAALTIAALRSVAEERRLSAAGLRAVVVDNASGDDGAISGTITQEGWSNWVTLIVAPRNGGFAYGNNLGIQHAYRLRSPDYVYLLNPDAEVRPGAIETLVRFMHQHKDVGIAGSSFENSDGSDWPIAFRFPTLTSELLGGMNLGFLIRLFEKHTVARTMPRINQPVDWICGASMLIRPQVLEAVGGMDENYFLYFEETDFCYRAKHAGFPTWYVPGSRVMHHAGQSTKVTDLSAGTKRLPTYWFESRRRYFAVTFGIGYAIATDIVALFANMVGNLKLAALGQRSKAVPHLITDLLRNSVIWKGNRQFPAAKCNVLTTSK